MILALTRNYVVDGDGFEESEDPFTSPEVLAGLSKSPSLPVRRRVALNPNTTPEVLLELTRDADPRVRFNALHAPGRSERLRIYLQSDGYGGMSYGDFCQNMRQP